MSSMSTLNPEAPIFTPSAANVYQADAGYHNSYPNTFQPQLPQMIQVIPQVNQMVQQPSQQPPNSMPQLLPWAQIVPNASYAVQPSPYVRMVPHPSALYGRTQSLERRQHDMINRMSQLIPSLGYKQNPLFHQQPSHVFVNKNLEERMLHLEQRQDKVEAELHKVTGRISTCKFSSERVLWTTSGKSVESVMDTKRGKDSQILPVKSQRKLSLKKSLSFPSLNRVAQQVEAIKSEKSVYRTLSIQESSSTPSMKFMDSTDLPLDMNLSKSSMECLTSDKSLKNEDSSSADVKLTDSTDLPLDMNLSKSSMECLTSDKSLVNDDLSSADVKLTPLNQKSERSSDNCNKIEHLEKRLKMTVEENQILTREKSNTENQLIEVEEKLEKALKKTQKMTKDYIETGAKYEKIKNKLTMALEHNKELEKMVENVKKKEKESKKKDSEKLQKILKNGERIQSLLREKIAEALHIFKKKNVLNKNRRRAELRLCMAEVYNAMELNNTKIRCVAKNNNKEDESVEGKEIEDAEK